MHVGADVGFNAGSLITEDNDIENSIRRFASCLPDRQRMG